jgi:hypothetical protein
VEVRRWKSRLYGGCVGQPAKLCKVCHDLKNSCVSIHRTHLAQTLQYSNIVNIESNALHPTFSPMQSSLVVIHWFTSWSWCSSFHELTGLQVHWNMTCVSHHCCHFWNTPPPPQYAHIHRLVSINFLQVSTNVNGCNFFLMEEFNITPLLRIHLYVTRQFARLLLCCYLLQGNETNYLWEGSTSIAIPPASVSNVMGQHYQVGDITFGVTLLQQRIWTSIILICREN